MNPCLTDEELGVLGLSAELWNAFCALPDRHPADTQEMARDIHDIQNRIMARLATRLHPDFFNGSAL